MSINTDSELNQWLEMLRSSDVNERLVAVKTLQHLGEEEAVDALMIALEDESKIVQKIAVTALWEIANPIAIPALLKALASPDVEIRNEALSALGELIAPEHLPILLDVLSQEDLNQSTNPNINLQLNILILLRKIHDIQSLPAVLSFLNSPHPQLREAAITTLSYLNQVKICPSALALIGDKNELVRRAAALTLGHLADTEIIDLLSNALIKDTDWQVRRNAAKSLVIHANKKAIPSVIIAITDTHWQVRKFALQFVHKVPDIRCLPLVIGALVDEYADVRKASVIALTNWVNSDTTPQVKNALQQALDDPDREVSIYAERAIAKLKLHQINNV
ncbi:HEAT repeat domain-containing protein [Calothrix sp. 336/3]|uniref:HEAT repeat domain-containing protein n=1 Tax=Calothrix sp. 336/3 TaxID=1337936 RepID=UPI0004E2A60E|nr:HEAT repeat domain-containing protein [Calothrix sp. 336/3]AKG21434.1 PBS lyase [Calothrix sp. 336/3]